MKKDVHLKMNERLADAAARYAWSRGISFTAAIHVLVTRGLQAEGNWLTGEPETEGSEINDDLAEDDHG